MLWKWNINSASDYRLLRPSIWGAVIPRLSFPLTLSWYIQSTWRDLSGLYLKSQWWALCNWVLHTWCQPQFMSLTTIPLVKSCWKPGGGKQTQCHRDINCLWHSAAIGCTSLLHTITFIISFYGSSRSAWLCSSVSLGLIDATVYASEIWNRRPSKVPVAAKSRDRHMNPFQVCQETCCWKNSSDPHCYGNVNSNNAVICAAEPALQLTVGHCHKNIRVVNYLQ